jgi:cytochrome c biogenesis protein CcdA
MIKRTKIMNKSKRILVSILIILIFTLLILANKIQQPFSSIWSIRFQTILLYLSLSISAIVVILISAIDTIKVSIGLKKVHIIAMVVIMVIGIHLLLVNHLLSVYITTSDSLDVQIQSLREWLLYIGSFLMFMSVIWTPKLR